MVRIGLLLYCKILALKTLHVLLHMLSTLGIVLKWAFVHASLGHLFKYSQACKLIVFKCAKCPLWKNFIKQWKSKELKGIVWQCTKSTTVAEFEDNQLASLGILE